MTTKLTTRWQEEDLSSIFTPTETPPENIQHIRVFTRGISNQSDPLTGKTIPHYDQTTVESLADGFTHGFVIVVLKEGLKK